MIKYEIFLPKSWIVTLILKGNDNGENEKRWG
jgi:hypothetical protein